MRLEWLRYLAYPLKAIYGLFFAAVTFPLGPDGDRSVRRHPWVSYAIVLLCFAGFQYQLVGEPGPEWLKAHQESWDAVEELLLEYPCLPAPRDLTDLRRSPEARELLQERARRCAEEGRTPGHRTKKAELDDLITVHRAIEGTHPTWRFYSRATDGALSLGTLTSMFMHDPPTPPGRPRLPSAAGPRPAEVHA